MRIGGDGSERPPQPASCLDLAHFAAFISASRECVGEHARHRRRGQFELLFLGHRSAHKTPAAACGVAILLPPAAVLDSHENIKARQLAAAGKTVWRYLFG
jgi:hypothetical protein